ncbi:cGMP-dependent protein kinase 2, partial [Plakobranchus ocellatus]
RSRMPPWAIDVMSQPPHRRTPQQIQHLKHLLATMRSFRENITDDMRTKMCEVVRYTKCDKGRVVLRQGHVGHDFYFIFSGSVFIQIDVYDAVRDETRTSVENVLRMGEGFGEIALLGDGHRTASVICKEPTELCQIDKATFLDVCPALFNQQLQDKVNFAREFPLFSLWDPEDLKKLCFLSQVLDVPHSTVIETNWARPDFAYFVMKGRVSMLKEFDVTDIEEKARTTRGVQDEALTKRAQTPSDDKDKRKKHTRFANVGTLGTGSHTPFQPPVDWFKRPANKTPNFGHYV